MFYTINQALCKECGLCKLQCFLNLEGMRCVNPNMSDCCGCGHCFMVCPNNAIEPLSNELEGHTDFQTHNIPFNNLKTLLEKRRSYRIFTDKDIDNEIINELIKAARFVPSGGNRHSYEFTVIKSNDIKDLLRSEIMKIYKNRGMILKSNILKTLVSPFVDAQSRSLLKGKSYYERIQYMLKLFNEGQDLVFYSAPVAIVIHSNNVFPTPKEDAVLAGYNINLLAETIGLGGCFVTLVQYAINTSKKCKKKIGLAAKDDVHAVIVLGYPKKYYVKAPIRLIKSAKFI